jgi:(2Fe-2S) ferredoxin
LTTATDLPADQGGRLVAAGELGARAFAAELGSEVDLQLDRRHARFGKGVGRDDGADAKVEREELGGGGHARGEGERAAAGALRCSGGMSQYERHVFVCEGKHCARAGGDVRDVVKESVDRAGLKRRVRVNRAGCLGQCGHGPMVVRLSRGRLVRRGPVDRAGARRIGEEHLLGARG